MGNQSVMWGPEKVEHISGKFGKYIKIQPFNPRGRAYIFKFEFTSVKVEHLFLNSDIYRQNWVQFCKKAQILLRI